MKLALLVLAAVLLAGAAAAGDLDPVGYGLNVTMHGIPLWFVFQYSSPVTITSYNFTPWNNFGVNNSWMILGSNDGRTLYPLDTEVNTTTLNSGTNYTFNLTTTGSFTYYYVYLYYGFGSSGEKMLVNLYAGAQQPAPVYAYVAGQEQPWEPGVVVLGVASFIGFAGYRRIRGGVK